MKRTDLTIHRHPRGFTLVEIMVVITVIAILMGIFVFVIGNVLNSGRETQTRGTLKKIDQLIDDRMRALRIATERDRFAGRLDSISNQWTSGPSYKTDLLTVCLRKHLLGKYFGMDLLLDPPGSEVSSQAAVEAYSSELLYELLMKGTINGANPVPEFSITAAEIDFSSGEIGDTDGDGKLEFVDGWGNPLRFYLWPTFLSQIDFANTDRSNLFLRLYNPAAAEKPENIIGLDPDDPKGVLTKAAAGGYLSDLNSESIFEFEFNQATPSPHHFDRYHAPIVISAGPDGTLGVKEFNQSILAEPIADINITQNDAGEPDHVYNSVMNDDLTNQQGLGGN
ncbi:MAG: hypothetical protein CMJ46_10615 [Planctomyces sp.]|nr:hypothetical protein [Planctomyces sp.]